MIKLVATDIDGTFLKNDRSFDVAKFEKILSRMKEIDCDFVVASGNQYYQLKKMFADYGNEISVVSDNGAYVEFRGEFIFAADIPKKIVIDVTKICKNFADISLFLFGVKSAYVQRDLLKSEVLNFMQKYVPRLKFVDSFGEVDDQFLKFAVFVPNEKLADCYKFLRENLRGKLKAVTSGFNTIDLILQDCNKASGIKKIIERKKISPAECAAFGDGENDIEMLKFCGQSYAMANATQNVKISAKNICPSNEDDGVLITLEKIFEL